MDLRILCVSAYFTIRGIMHALADDVAFAILALLEDRSCGGTTCLRDSDPPAMHALEFYDSPTPITDCAIPVLADHSLGNPCIAR